MKNEEILKKAIEKAVENGGHEKIILSVDEIFERDLVYSIIFSHEFAKAFWSKDDEWSREWVNHECYWKGCLQTMVLETDPIKYLEKFL